MLSLFFLYYTTSKWITDILTNQFVNLTELKLSIFKQVKGYFQICGKIQGITGSFINIVRGSYLATFIAGKMKSSGELEFRFFVSSNGHTWVCHRHYLRCHVLTPYLENNLLVCFGLSALETAHTQAGA